MAVMVMMVVVVVMVRLLSTPVGPEPRCTPDRQPSSDAADRSIAEGGEPILSGAHHLFATKSQQPDPGVNHDNGCPRLREARKHRQNRQPRQRNPFRHAVACDQDLAMAGADRVKEPVSETDRHQCQQCARFVRP